MSKVTKAGLASTLAKPGRYMLLTHGEGYSLDDGRAVDRRIAETAIGLWGDTALPVQRKGETAVVPNEDGLFPGHSQTWTAVS